MSDWKRIRHAVWHPSTLHLREIQDDEPYQPCYCLPASAGGTSCSTSECVNRGCYMECVPSLCPCGDECRNQEIERQALPRVEIRKMGGAKGMGAIALEPIESDRLVCEYIGEVIDQKELYRRRQTQYKNMRHTYIMTYIKGLLIDATQKGNWARYLNHSCAPNCCTQKWIVGGRTRVGIFTKRRCEAGEELTYDYNLEWNGFARIKCECKAANCSGWLGGRSDSMQAQLVLHDSDDDVISDGEDGEPVTKVAPLSMPAPPPKATEHGASKRARSSPPGSAQALRSTAELDTQDQAATELAALEELPLDEAMQLCVECASSRYPTVPEDPAVAQPVNLDAAHDSIESDWQDRCSVVKRLLQGMQQVSVKRRVRLKPAASRGKQARVA